MVSWDLKALAIFACTSLLLTTCTGLGNQTYAYKLYPGPPRATSEIAIVQLGFATGYEFNNRPVSSFDWTEVHLLPGEHAIQWSTRLSDGSVDSYFAKDLVLEAGHVYSLKTSVKGWSKEVAYFWATDISTGETIAGTPEP